MMQFVDDRYECTGCGRCCQGWEIALVPGEADEFRERAAPFVPVDRLKGALRRERRGGETEDFLVLGKGCAVLDDNGDCRIHATQGSEAKPRVCRIFPYTFVAAPDGAVRVGVSYACEAVVDGVGTKLAEQHQHLEEFLASSIDGTPFLLRHAAEVALAPGLVVPWSDAAQLIAELVAALRAPGRLVERVARAAALCTMVQAQLEDGVSFATALTAARDGRDAVVSAALAATPTVERMARTLLRTLIASTAPRDQPVRSRIWQTLAAIGGGGRVLLPAGSVARAEVEGVARGIDEDGEQLLARWMAGTVESLIFFGPGAGGLTIAGGLDLLIVSIASALFVARAVAASEGRAKVSLADLKRAVPQIHAGMYHRSNPPGLERMLAGTETLDLLRAQL